LSSRFINLLTPSTTKSSPLGAEVPQPGKKLPALYENRSFITSTARVKATLVLHHVFTARVRIVVDETNTAIIKITQRGEAYTSTHSLLFDSIIYTAILHVINYKCGSHGNAYA
jgi:hypothetical protein